MSKEMEEEFDVDSFLSNIRDNSKKLKDVKKKFDNFINARLVDLEEFKKELIEFPHSLILLRLKEFDIDKSSELQVARILLLMNYLDQDVLKEYKEYFDSNYQKLPLPTPPEKPAEMKPELIKAYNQEISDYKNKVLPPVEQYNSKINSIIDVFIQLVEDGLFGDETLDKSELRYVYFKFFDLDESYVKHFIKDLKSSSASDLELIKTIEIIDIKGQVPDHINDAFEVRLYFEKGKDVELLESCKVLFESFYEKYMQMSETMRLGSVDWGLDIMRKNNMINTQSAQSFQGTHNIKAPNGLDEDTDDFELDEIVESFDEESQIYFSIDDYVDDCVSVNFTTVPGVSMDDNLVGETMYPLIIQKIKDDLDSIPIPYNKDSENWNTTIEIDSDSPEGVYETLIDALGYVYDTHRWDALEFESHEEVNMNNFKMYISWGGELEESFDGKSYRVDFYSSPFYSHVYDQCVGWMDARVEKAFSSVQTKYGNIVYIDIQASENHHVIYIDKSATNIREILEFVQTEFEKYNMSFKTGVGGSIDQVLITIEDE
jgi:hypothetical protein